MKIKIIIKKKKDVEMVANSEMTLELILQAGESSLGCLVAV